jgi:hypothetical protein
MSKKPCYYWVNQTCNLCIWPSPLQQKIHLKGNFDVNPCKVLPSGVKNNLK